MRPGTTSCGHCRAVLKIDDAVSVITCVYCACELEIRREGPEVTTEVLSRPYMRIDEIAEGVGSHPNGGQIRELDLQWELRCIELRVHGKDGRAADLSITAGVISCLGGACIGLIGPILGILIMIYARTFHAEMYGGLIAFGSIAVAFTMIMSGLGAITKTFKYRKEYAAYQRQRAKLLAP